jgi:membrane protease YdiL (CAAX protease family)
LKKQLTPGKEIALATAATLVVVFVTGWWGQLRWLTYAAFLYVPVIVAWLRGWDFAVFGLWLPDKGKTARYTLAAACIVFPLFTLGYFGTARLLGLPWAPGWEGDMGAVVQFIIIQMVLVAFAEEFFFRGYLQHRLDQVWAPRWRILGARLGPAWLAASALFALGHLGEGMHADRLATFLPGLWFGWLRAATGNIYGAVVLHGASNLLIAYLQGQPLAG